MGKRQKILIVDDAPANISVLVKALTSDYEISVAVTGEDALSIVTSDRAPDLVLLDIMMPGMDGYEVCRRMKNDAATREIPIIFITAKDDEEDETRGLELGAVDYITKPFSPPIVKARVKTHLELKRKSDLLENLASLDGLTCIANRRRFDQILEVEWSRALRTESWISVIMMDIDFFKPYNDNYGHAAGDDCLRKVAEALETSLRRSADTVARYGGEEFVAILPGTDPHGALVVAENMRHSVESLAIEHAYSAVSPLVTISAGVASAIPMTESSAGTLVASADKRLYEAKSSGRNRVES